MNTKKLALILDDGHGSETPGKRSPITNMKENEFNKAVVNHMVDICKENNILYKEVAPSDIDIPLSDRTKAANLWYKGLIDTYGKENVVCVYLSIHANAGGGSGCEAWVVHNASDTTSDMARNILNEIDKIDGVGIGLKSRGVKYGYICNHKNKPACGCNFHVNSATNMPSVLIEHAFMDTQKDASLLLDDTFRKKCAVANVIGVMQTYGFNITNVKDFGKSKMYAIDIFSFKNKADAETVSNFLTLCKFYNEVCINGKEWRVYSYSYTDLNKVKSIIEALKIFGCYAECKEI